MAFITSGQDVVSFANSLDVEARDTRLFETNEVLTADPYAIDDLCIRSTERILAKLRATTWWRSYFYNRSPSGINTVADVPVLDPNLIKDRLNDFTDLCVYNTLAEFILPKIADFGSEDNAERKKMDYYLVKARELFDELVEAGDWYDFDNSGIITSDEKEPTTLNLRRVR